MKVIVYDHICNKEPKLKEITKPSEMLGLNIVYVDLSTVKENEVYMLEDIRQRLRARAGIDFV